MITYKKGKAMFSTIKKNEGDFDRSIRIIGSTTVIIYAILTQMWWLLLFAVPLFVTGAIGFCGVYALFGISTCPVAAKPMKKSMAKASAKPKMKVVAKPKKVVKQKVTSNSKSNKKK